MSIDTLSDYQRAIADQMKANGVVQTPILMALGVNEEAGEIAHAVLKHEQGLRGYDNQEYYESELRDAIGDTAIYLMQLCQVMGWQFENVVVAVARHVLKRNAQGYPKEEATDD